MNLKTRRSTIIAIGIIFLIIVLYVILWLGFDYYFHPSYAINFSDKFFAISALFSALAFALLIITLYSQKKELRLQRQELQRQRFETTFFNQLEYFDRLTQSFSWWKPITLQGNKSKEYYYGYEAFTNTYKEINSGKNRLSNSIDEATLFLHKLFAENGYELRFYFQQFIDIIEFVERNDFESKDKYFYISIIRNKLTSPQLALLLYYHIAYRKHTKVELLNKWVIFKNLSEVDIEISKEIYLQVISEEAFNEGNRYK